jgi:hypothetical protein
MGVKEPSATFSACFGGAFLMWHPMKYAAMLAENMRQHNADAWLVNTGAHHPMLADTVGYRPADNSVPTKTVSLTDLSSEHCIPSSKPKCESSTDCNCRRVHLWVRGSQHAFTRVFQHVCALVRTLFGSVALAINCGLDLTQHLAHHPLTMSVTCDYGISGVAVRTCSHSTCSHINHVLLGAFRSPAAACSVACSVGRQ